MNATRPRTRGPANVLWLVGFLFFALGTILVLLVLDAFEGLGLLERDGLPLDDGLPRDDGAARRGRGGLDDEPLLGAPRPAA